MSSGGDSGYPPNPNHIIQYAPYIETWHATWLGTVNADALVAKANNPYTSAIAYNPDTDIDAMLASLNAFCNAILAFHNDSLDISAVAAAFDQAKTVATFEPIDDWTDNVSTAKSVLDNTLLNTTQISAATSTFAAILDADIQAKSLPVFQAGMRDINAVMSSAFIVGEALIMAEKDRNVAKFQSDLTLANWSDRNKALVAVPMALTDANFKLYAAYISVAEMLGKFFIQGTEYKRVLTQSLIDALRMKIVSKKEQSDENLRIQSARRKWDLEMSQYEASMIGSAGGGHAVPQGTGDRTSVTSVLGGVMAGASIGAMFNSETGGSWGTIGGAVAGGAIAAFA